MEDRNAPRVRRGELPASLGDDMTPGGRPFSKLMADSEHKVLVNRITNTLVNAAHSLKVAQPVSLAFLSVAAVGPTAAVVSALLDDRTVNFTLIPLGIFAVLGYCLVAFPRITWRQLTSDSSSHEELLPSATAEDELASWMAKQLRIGPQIAGAAAAFLFAIPVALIVVHALHLHAQDCIPYIISVAVTATLGVSNVWWLWHAPALIRWLAHQPVLQLDWRSPADSHGLRQLRALMLKSSVRATIGVSLFSLALVITAARAGHSLAVQFFAYAGLCASFATVVFILVIPQYWLVACVKRNQTTLAAQCISTLPVNMPSGSEDLSAPLALLLYIESRPVSVWDLKWTATLMLTVAGAVAPYIPLIIELIR